MRLCGGLWRTLLLLSLAVAGGAERSAPGACDRACLEGFVDRYLDAMVAHDAKLVPLANDVKFTENGQHLQIPDALWNSIAAKGTYRLFVSDPEAREVAFIGTIREEARTPDGAPAVLALRLRIDNRLISEVETLVVRNERAAENLEKLGQPNPVFLKTVPPAERMSREDLTQTANLDSDHTNDYKGRRSPLRLPSNWLGAGAARVVPLPGRFDHSLQRGIERDPVQFPAGARGVRHQDRRISGAARHVVDRHLPSRHSFHRCDYFVDGLAVPRA